MRNEFFMQVFTCDLMPHQDDATTGEELVEGVIEMVRWHQTWGVPVHVVEEHEVPQFLEWLEDERPELITIAQDSIDASNAVHAEGA